MARRRILLLSALALAGCGGGRAAPAARAPASEAVPDLQRVEQQLNGAVLVCQRRALLAELQDDPALVPYVLTVLQDPRSSAFPVCARLAVQLHLTEAFELLLAAVADRSSPHRAAALIAAQQLQEVPLPLLLRALDDDDDGVRLAVLQSLHDHDDLPFDTVARLLTAANPLVAAAAAAVVPIGDDHVVPLARLDLSDALTGAAVVAQLGCRPLPAVVLAGWQQRLPSLLPKVQIAVLAAVRRRPECADSRLLQRLVQTGSNTRLRFEALHGLLAANAATDAWLLQRTASLPRALQLLAAVQLLRHDRREGAAALVALAFDDGPAAADEVADESGGDGGSAAGEGALPSPMAETSAAAEKVPDAVALAARRVLSAVAGLPLHRGLEAFEAWSRDPHVQQRAALALPDAAAVFGANAR
jgi:hypothetical protein